jgi:hypothetical protein
MSAATSSILALSRALEMSTTCVSYSDSFACGPPSPSPSETGRGLGKCDSWMEIRDASSDFDSRAPHKP